MPDRGRGGAPRAAGRSVAPTTWLRSIILITVLCIGSLQVMETTALDTPWDGPASDLSTISIDATTTPVEHMLMGTSPRIDPVRFAVEAGAFDPLALFVLVSGSADLRSVRFDHHGSGSFFAPVDPQPDPAPSTGTVMEEVGTPRCFLTLEGSLQWDTPLEIIDADDSSFTCSVPWHIPVSDGIGRELGVATWIALPGNTDPLSDVVFVSRLAVNATSHFDHEYTHVKGPTLVTLDLPLACDCGTFRSANEQGTASQGVTKFERSAAAMTSTLDVSWRWSTRSVPGWIHSALTLAATVFAIGFSTTAFVEQWRRRDWWSMSILMVPLAHIPWIAALVERDHPSHGGTVVFGVALAVVVTALWLFRRHHAR